MALIHKGVSCRCNTSWAKANCGKFRLLFTVVLTATLLALLGLSGCGASAPAAPSKTPATSAQYSSNPSTSTMAEDFETDQASKPTAGKTTSDNSASSESDKPTAFTPSSAGALQVKGAQLCDSKGKPVQLRGVSTHGLAWYPQYVNQEFFTELRQDWNANVVRLALYTAESGGYCTDGDQEQLFDLIEAGVTYATEADLYVIVDWHILSDNNPLTHQDEAADFFSRLSAQLGDQDNVLYEICNEPNGGTTWEDIAAYAQDIIPIIRANDPDAIIIVGTPTWSQEIDKAQVAPLEFDNIMYTLHFYAATHKDDLRQRLKTAVEDGLPVFVTEFGICDASGNGQIDYDSANAWIQLMNSLDVSYICWNLSNKNETSALFKPDCRKTSDFETTDLSEEGLWLWDILHNESPSAPKGTSQEEGNTSKLSNDNTSSTGNNASNSASSDSATSATGTTSNFSWSVALKNSWSTDGIPYYQYDATITNKSGTTATNWQIRIPFSGSFQLSDSWNGQFAIDGNDLVIASVDYNGTLSPNQTATDVGFIVSGAPIAP